MSLFVALLALPVPLTASCAATRAVCRVQAQLMSLMWAQWLRTVARVRDASRDREAKDDRGGSGGGGASSGGGAKASANSESGSEGDRYQRTGRKK